MRTYTLTYQDFIRHLHHQELANELSKHAGESDAKLAKVTQAYFVRARSMTFENEMAYNLRRIYNNDSAALPMAHVIHHDPASLPVRGLHVHNEGKLRVPILDDIDWVD